MILFATKSRNDLKISITFKVKILGEVFLQKKWLKSQKKSSYTYSSECQKDYNNVCTLFQVSSKKVETA